MQLRRCAPRIRTAATVTAATVGPSAYALPVPLAPPPGGFLMPEQSHLAVKEETFEKPLPGMPMSMPPRMELREAHAIPPPTPPPFIMPLAPPLALLVPPLRPPPGPPPATVPAPPEAPRVVPAKYSAASQPSFSKSTSVVFAKRTGVASMG
eukprot:symbB.v1.2.004865.t1/scaffold264.1/size247971/6